ncbi:MAG: hypothetical protein EBV32_03830, partial [Proteobacteria bacterium]|nr:hypothetical protein [Candidatus Fonsibacter lacus]NCU72301.1 hypothetical protein [Candidatus Fonsibacter lacus]
MPPAVLLHPAENVPQAGAKPPRQFKRMPTGRPTNRQKGGQWAWLKRLQNAGRMAEAAAWARRHRLHPEPEPAEAATPADAADGAHATPPPA